MKKYISTQKVTKQLMKDYGLSADENGVIYQDGKPLPQYINRSKTPISPCYARVTVDSRNGLPRAFMDVHALVAVWFIGEPGVGMEIDHKNGISCDNRLENIQIITKRENLIKRKGNVSNKMVRRWFDEENIEELTKYCSNLYDRSGYDLDEIVQFLYERAYNETDMNKQIKFTRDIVRQRVKNNAGLLGIGSRSISPIIILYKNHDNSLRGKYDMFITSNNKIYFMELADEVL